MQGKFTAKKMAEDASNADISKKQHYQIDPRALKVEEGFNLRMPGPELDEHIEEMKAAHRAGAVFPPVVFRVDAKTGDMILIDGHCRRRMYVELIEEGVEIEKVDAIQFDGNDADRVAFMLGSGNGKQYSTLEQGIGYLRLERFGWTRAAIIARSGRSSTHVDQALMLAKANSDLQGMVQSGAVSARQAIEMVREHGEQAGAVLAPLVAKARSQGKKKVKPSAIAGKKLPRPLLDRCASQVGELFTALDSDTREAIEDADDEEVIALPARHLKALLAAHAEMQKIQKAEPEQTSLMEESETETA
jgi:ParB family transcriptional regulator, chromosome partitioning protein